MTADIKKHVYVDSEVGELKRVLLASVSNFYVHRPFNDTQRHFYPTDPPSVEALVRQQSAFVEVLESHGVEIIWLPPRRDSPNQVNVRDVATAIRQRLVLCAMKWPIRQKEVRSVRKILSMLDAGVVEAGGGTVEGGDVILDGGRLFIGRSERTSVEGIRWMEREFGATVEVVPLGMRPPFIHLDVVFNLVGDKTALVYAAGLEQTALTLIKDMYSVIEITAEEQFALGTNVFSISPEVVVCERRHKRIAEELRARRLKVIQLEYSELTKIGGSFRCSTCPIERAR